MRGDLFAPITLPNGQTIPNRIAKAAMEENLAAPGQVPSEEHIALYRAWGKGGAGLILTGNVMVAEDHVTSPHGLVLDGNQPIDKFHGLASAAREEGAQVWMQINHTGRQMQSDIGTTPLAPSAIPVHTRRGTWPVPREMTSDEIEVVVQQFVVTAIRAIEAGFTGVQIHGAHGYLLSQFLSPLANLRTDRWGGALSNRCRLLCTVIDAVRASLPEEAAVGLKLNTADFQRGGFDTDDAAQVISWLNDYPIDLLELSGGTVESPAMNGAGVSSSSLMREAYFLESVGSLQAIARMPLMLTGGIRSREAAQRVRASGIDLLGIGTSLALVPNLANRWQLEDVSVPAPDHVVTLSPPEISARKQAWVRFAMRSHAVGTPIPCAPDFERIFEADVARRRSRISEYRNWLTQRRAEREAGA